MLFCKGRDADDGWSAYSDNEVFIWNFRGNFWKKRRKGILVKRVGASRLQKKTAICKLESSHFAISL